MSSPPSLAVACCTCQPCVTTSNQVMHAMQGVPSRSDSGALH